MRDRLTITLKQGILEALDAQIDGDRLRNRSHAIEYYLAKSLGQKALKVLILAGGKPVYPNTFAVENREQSGKENSLNGGNKLKKEYKSAGVDFGSSSGGKPGRINGVALPGRLPKAMVKIAGKPLLEQTLLKLKNAKFSDIVISIGEGGHIIKDYFKNGQNLGLNISYIEQGPKISGPAQALLQAKEILGSDNFLLIYGDVLSDIDYTDLMQFHSLNKPAICTMAVTSTESAGGLWGLAKMQGSRIVDFEEKPETPKTFSRLINAGIYLMEAAIFKYIEGSAKKLESSVFPRLAQEGKLYGYLYEGLWLDISSSAAYKQAVKEISRN